VEAPSLTRWPPGYEPEPRRPKDFPKELRDPRFRSRKRIVRFSEICAAKTVSGELEPSKARALVSYARLALEAWALELTGKAQVLKPLEVQMIDFRTLVSLPKDNVT
jgi:hypothetical protein